MRLAFAVLTAIVVAWLGGMAYAVGGIGELYRLNAVYLLNESSSQPALGAVGIDPCPPACPGTVSEGYKPPWPWKGSGT